MFCAPATSVIRQGFLRTLCAGALAVGLSACPWGPARSAGTASGHGPAPAGMTPTEAVAVSVYRKASPAVVHITTLAASETAIFGLAQIAGTGSGCILTKDGYIITNYHVIKGAQTVRVKLSDGTDLPAEVVGSDAEYDLAVIKVQPGKKVLTPIQLGDSSRLEVGRYVYAIGNPFGYELSMSHGIVSSLGRTIDIAGRRPLKGLIQTDAATNPGSSGGPVLDSQGHMIGLSTLIRTPKADVAGFIGIAFAIPVNLVKQIYPQLIKYHAVVRPDLGIEQVLTAQWAPGMLGAGDTGKGLSIVSLSKNGPAAAAGLVGKVVRQYRNGPFNMLVEDQAGADIIVKIDQVHVASMDDLLSYVETKKPGAIVTLTILRARQLKEIPVKLTSSAPTSAQ
jgi:S1-C subfamily serine protease